MRIVLCNCPPDAAPEIARTLIERRLAACVNLIPGVRSFYRWEGAVQDDAEVTMLIKVAASGVVDLHDALVELHPYSVPEILVLGVDLDLCHAPYVSWVRAETGRPAED